MSSRENETKETELVGELNIQLFVIKVEQGNEVWLRGYGAMKFVSLFYFLKMRKSRMRCI